MKLFPFLINLHFSRQNNPGIGKFWLDLLTTYTYINNVDDILKLDYGTLDETITLWVASAIDQMSIFNLLAGVFERTGRRNMHHMWPSPEQLEDDKQQKKMKEEQKSSKRKNPDRHEANSGRNSPARKEERKNDTNLGKSLLYYSMAFTVVLAVTC